MLNTPVSTLTRGMALLCAFLVFATFHSSAQWPGGVSGTLTTWFKANTTANLTIPNTTTNGVSQWSSEKNTFAITQATASRQPLFTATNTTAGNFNFNPFVQFSKTTNTVLYNTATTTNLLGDNGTVFMVINTYHTIADGNPSSFTYKNSVNYPSIAYQFKPAFRIQTGDGISGSTADYYNWGTPPSPVPNYPETAGILLTSKGVDKSLTDTYFNSRRNGDSIATTHRYDEPYDGYSYTPSVSYGFFLGSDASTTGAQNMSCGIAELITFSTLLSEADQNKVESYLAIKYGITLTKKQSAYNLNYVSATGTVIWDTTVNAGYRNNITGIGRDDQSALLQKQSRSIHNNAFISLYNGFGYTSLPTANLTNTSTVTADNSFLLTADNGLSTALNTCSPDNQLLHMARTWKVQKTGTGIDSVTIAVNTADIPANVTRILVSADNTFPANATTLYPLQSISGQLAAAVRLTDKVYFTFGTDTLHVSLTTVQPDCDHPNAGAITASVTGGVSPYTYSWTPSATTTTGITNLSGGSYTLAVTQGGCTYTTSSQTIQAVEAASTPQIDAQSVCANAAATLTVKNAATGNSYNWYTTSTGGTALSSTAPGTSYSTGTLTTATTYYVEATSSTGCKSSPRTAVTVSILPILAKPAVTVTTVTLNSITFSWTPVTGATSYQVSVNNGQWQTPSDPASLSHTVTGLTPMTEATLQVKAFGASDCQTSQAGAATGKTLSAEVYIPNVFTPNADGKNDVFKVYSNIISSLQMKVFNQWGELIFSSSNVNDGWDGLYKGKPQPVGIYVYAIKITLTNGTQIVRKGDINLLR